MAKTGKQPRHYRVTTVFRVPQFRPIYLEGIFIPKGGECSATKIKEQCWDYLKKQINFDEQGVSRDMIEKDIKIKAIPYDFVVCEDK